LNNFNTGKYPDYRDNNKNKEKELNESKSLIKSNLINNSNSSRKEPKRLNNDNNSNNN